MILSIRYQKSEITFFGTTVFKVFDQLCTKLYTKPTDQQIYLLSKSKRHRSLKNNIAYSQPLNKTCYNKRDIKKTRQKLLKILTNRGYDKTETMSHISNAIAVPRNEILNKNSIENN